MSEKYRICPHCGFRFSTVSHDYGEKQYDCIVCGWEGFKMDDDEEISIDYLAEPEILENAKVISDIINSMYEEDDWFVEIIKNDTDGVGLHQRIARYGLGGVIAQLF